MNFINVPSFFILFGVLISMANCTALPQTTSHNSELEYIEIDSYKFHVKVVGKKMNPPLIVIHGGPGGDFHYLKSLEALSDRYYILFYDQRMTGLSSRESQKSPNIEQDIDDLHSIIEKFAGKKKVNLIGHSYGAMVAAGYLSRYANNVTHAIIIEPGILTQETAKVFVEMLKEKTPFLNSLNIILPLLKSIFVKSIDGHEKFDYVMTQMMGSSSGQPYQCKGIGLPPNSFQRAGFEVFNKTLRPMINNPDLFNSNIVSGLQKFPNKILLLSSSCSFIGFDYQETYHRKFFPKNTEHIILKNTGHNFLTTDSSIGISVIRNFLDEKSFQGNLVNFELTDKIKKELESSLDHLILNEKTPGFHYTLLDDSKILYQHSGGYSDLTNKIKVNQNTSFHLLSITKTFTSIAVLQLLDQGLLTLDDKILKYLPDHPYHKDTTIRNLLNHTSGIPNPIPLTWAHLEEESFDNDTFERKIIQENSKSKSNPGEKMNYSNIEYILLGQIIQKISGLDYQTFVRENILTKLSTFNQDLDFTIPTNYNHAYGYIKKYSFMNFALSLVMDKKKYLAHEENGWLQFRNYYVNGASFGGLIGNSVGLSKFLMELLNQKNVLLTEASKELLFQKSSLANGEKINMSLGWFYGEINNIPYYYHPGGAGGYYSEIRIYPTRRLASIILLNRTGISDEKLLDTFDSLIFNSFD
jgi:CubicO group peptidase (beta-lactamase class C family)/pimeloyl-ACP methyl ester carboxylesterase